VPTPLFLDRVSKVYPGASAFERALTLGRARHAPRLALADVTLRVEGGEIVALLGRNGAGKSTLMRCAAGLLTPSTGSVQAVGGDPAAHASIRAQIGLVVRDDRAFHLRLTGRENLRFFALLQRLDRREAARRIDRVFAQTSLTEVADVPFRSYSSGMKQRLGVARALLGEPRLLLMDEATSGLDPGLKAAFYRLTRQLVDETRVGVLYATHDLAEAEHLCDRSVVIDQGKVAANGSWVDVAPAARALFGLEA